MVCLILFSSPGLLSQPAAGVDDYINNGYAKFENKDYKGALTEFDKALQIDATNEKAVIGKVNILLYLDRSDDAMDFSEQGISKYPQKAIYYYSRGLVNHFEKDDKKAIDDYNKALELDNSIASKIYLSRGNSYLSLKDLEKAIDDFSSSVDKDTSNLNAYFSRGKAYYIDENYQKAIYDFKKVTDSDKKNGTAYFNLGMSYYKVNDVQNACRYFQMACQLNITDACKLILTDCTKNR